MLQRLKQSSRRKTIFNLSSYSITFYRMLKVYLHDISTLYMNHYKEAIYTRKEQNTKQETTYLQIRLYKILFTLLLKRFLRQMAVIMNLCTFIIKP